MQQWLKTINQAVDDAGGAVTKKKAEIYRQQYRHSLKQTDIECPPPDAPPGKAKRERVKRSKGRNLLERLTHYEEDVLRFMENPLVPFTNNRGENDICMTKVQQKISGCFRSEEGAKIFCRVRGYLSTCCKKKINASQALRLVFEGKLPDFVQ
jgi:transposase